jgi:hypothetical protein
VAHDLIIQSCSEALTLVPIQIDCLSTYKSLSFPKFSDQIDLVRSEVNYLQENMLFLVLPRNLGGNIKNI